MLTGYVIYKDRQPLLWLADEDTRHALNNSGLLVGYIFFDKAEAEQIVAKPELFEFDDNVKLSIREIKLPVIR